MLLFTHLLGFTFFLNPSPLPPPITPTHTHKTLIKGLVITCICWRRFFFLFSSGSSECNIFFEEIRWSKSTKLCALPARWRGTTYNLPCVSLCVCGLSKLCCWPRRQVNLVIAFTPTSRPTKDFSWSFLPRFNPNSLSGIRLWTDTKGRSLFPLPQLQKD